MAVEDKMNSILGRNASLSQQATSREAEGCVLL